MSKKNSTVIFSQVDGKQRTVSVQENKNGYTVTKEIPSHPVSENFKDKKKALARAQELIEDTSN